MCINNDVVNTEDGEDEENGHTKILLSFKLRLRQ